MRKLSVGELNRTLLDRQRLLSRSAESPEEIIKACAGLQSQKPSTMFLGLWNRCSGFNSVDLDQLLLSGRVVRIASMRSTIHVLTVDDAHTFRTATQSVLANELHATNKELAKSDEAPKVVRHAEKLLKSAPMTAKDLSASLHQIWPHYPAPTLLALVRAMLPLVQVPPRGLWGQSAAPSYQLLQVWSPDRRAVRPREKRSIELLIRSYLSAFGPATVADAQTWSGLRGVKEVLEGMRPRLAKYIGPNDEVLYDNPGAALIDADVPSPVRFVGEFDNVVLSHKNRERIVSAENRDKLRSPNGLIPSVLLIDGYVSGVWTVLRVAGKNEVQVELFRPISASVSDDIEKARVGLQSFLQGTITL